MLENVIGRWLIADALFCQNYTTWKNYEHIFNLQKMFGWKQLWVKKCIQQVRRWRIASTSV